MLSFKDLKYKPQGIIHIGAHLGEEKEEYGSIPVIWVEGNPRVLGRLRENVGKDLVIPHVISNFPKTTTFNITSNTESSSLNSLITHSIRYPNISVKNKIIVVTKSFSSVIKEYKIDMSTYNFLVISAAGSELDVLQGFDRYLDFIDGIFTKFYEEQVYENNPSLNALNLFLSQRGYILNQYVNGDEGWGKAYFIKQFRF